ncbi:MAG TPA: bifunctional phosphoribosylaminoimidazolecarboxamide formyltransferase/IMP cyclohydrolase, partial [Longimicrobiales bacterium]
MPTALLSVSDKRGVVEFARGLAAAGWELVSTGGTGRTLRAAGLPVFDVSELTGHPEILGGRVKTLHPAVHAGILARRDVANDMDTLDQYFYRAIDLVAVNLYPFHEAVAGNVALDEAMHEVDIGGPTMLRAAAKNHAAVLTVVDPDDYDRIIEALRAGDVPLQLRRELARKVFDHTARYDRAIAGYFDRHMGASSELFPETLTLELRHAQALRYGENPDQPAAFYLESNAPADSLAGMKQLHGKELSFNNLLDVEAAVMSIAAWSDAVQPACAVIKHTTPCGVAVGRTLQQACEHALKCDPVSAFGGIVAFNQPLDGATADALAAIFLEIVVAPAFEPAALAVLQKKKNLRLVALPVGVSGPDELDFKRVRGGMLAQIRMRMAFPETDWKTVTERAPNAAELADLRFAWRVCAAVKSNAIVLAREERTLGIGAGQMSRVDSSRIAVMKAHDQGADL